MRFVSFLLFTAALVGCTNGQTNGSVQVNLIQPTGPNCQFGVQPATVQTLQDIHHIRGTVGQVVYHDNNLLQEIGVLQNRTGVERVDTQFSLSANTYTPLDLDSLFSISLYWSIEQGHLLFSRLDPLADLSQRVPNFSETLIIHNARIREEGAANDTTDNAAYLGYYFPDSSGQLRVNNFFVSFPNNSIQTIPLGVNLGVLVHEYSHLESFYLFRFEMLNQLGGDGSQIALSAWNTLGGFDEGVADYFGFLASGDPAFLLCSFPNQRRNLANPKPISQAMLSDIASNADHDPHESGAAFASILYQIGEAIGSHETVAKSLIQMQTQLGRCVNGDYSSIDFAKIRDCHLPTLSEHSGTARTIYGQYLGGQ